MKTERRVLLDRAARQHGVVARRQAVADGLSESAVDRMIRNGLFVPVAAGVFRARGAVPTPMMAVMAATLAARGHSSHSTAMHLMRLCDGDVAIPVHVTVDASVRQPRVRWVEVPYADRSRFPLKSHRCIPDARVVTIVDGIPASDAARTLIDMAPLLSAVQLEDAFERARRFGLLSIDHLAERFERIGGRGRPGSGKIRDLLTNTAPGALESKLEVHAWRLLRSARPALGLPVRQFWVDAGGGRRFRLDFAWPHQLVAFETEGFQWHGTRTRWKQDRVRSAVLERLGWRLVVATWDDVVLRPEATIERLELALTDRRRAA